MYLYVGLDGALTQTITEPSQDDIQNVIDGNMDIIVFKNNQFHEYDFEAKLVPVREV